MSNEAFFDAAMVHLLTTATLDRLRVLYPQGRFEVRRFRPNIVVQLASDEEGFAENAWVGHSLAIGPAVRLKITSASFRPSSKAISLLKQLTIENPVERLRALRDDDSRAGGSAEGFGNPAHGSPA